MSMIIAGILATREQLRAYRRAGTSPFHSELGFEIGIYNYILEDKNPLERANEYLQARKILDDTRPVNKRQVIKILKWEITDESS